MGLWYVSLPNGQGAMRLGPTLSTKELV
jgi:hypothetical protein